ncbi:MAG: helix-turn-helix transcriptional regulator [Clostridia bacterium]|nr:helix-turn-helix transcriptional regulator [Clostridia bacterium]MBQ8321395.1 helix-turn-helix transcriptional regulator [Clostridia bacterium]
MQYHKIIKNLRIDNNVSQQTIADFIGIDRVTYNRLENEKYSIKFDYIIKIAEFYNVPIDYLAGRSGTYQKSGNSSK